MDTISIDKSKLLEAYRASKENKELLESLYGKELFYQDIKNRVRTFEGACRLLYLSPNVSMFIFGLSDSIAYEKLKVIAQALNEGWKPDWDNSDEYKWAPWFYLNKPGFRFRDAVCCYAGTYSSGGSRLCFKSRELADYAGRQFLDLYKDFLS